MDKSNFKNQFSRYFYYNCFIFPTNPTVQCRCWFKEKTNGNSYMLSLTLLTFTHSLMRWIVYTINSKAQHTHTLVYTTKRHVRYCLFRLQWTNKCVLVYRNSNNSYASVNELFCRLSWQRSVTTTTYICLIHSWLATTKTWFPSMYSKVPVTYTYTFT